MPPLLKFVPQRHCCRSSSWYACHNQFAGASRRGFHATPQHRFVDTCLSGTHTLITGLHTISGLSWVVTLPLTALLVRLCLVAPITTYVHSITQRRSQQRPLLEGWAHIYRKQIIKEHAAAGPEKCQQLLAKKLTQKSAEIYQQTGTQRWKSMLNFLQFPVWLIVIETIRRMCGTREGLIGMVQASWNEKLLGEASTNDKGSMSEPSDLELDFASNDSHTLPLEGKQMLEDVAGAPVVPIEPSLATEGALWFPDLLIPDPQLILPFMLSATMFANIRYQERTRKKRGWQLGALQRRIGNASKIVVLAVGPLTLTVPSAIHVYWISSSAFALVNNIFLDRYLPVSTAVQPFGPKTPERGGEENSIGWERQTQQIQSTQEQKERRRSRISLSSRRKP